MVFEQLVLKVGLENIPYLQPKQLTNAGVRELHQIPVSDKDQRQIILRITDPESQHGKRYGVGVGLAMFCQLKSGFIDHEAIRRLEKYNSWAGRGVGGLVGGSQIRRSVDPESQHGTRYGVGVGPGYVLPIKWCFLDFKPIHLQKHDSWEGGGYMDHGSREMSFQKANMEPGIG